MSSDGQSSRRGPYTRRAFLRVGGLGVVGLSLGEQASWALSPLAARRRAIFILMTGGASQLDTFDPKPDATSSVRGTLKAIATSVPGLFLSETLPRLAERAHRFALVRSLTHDAAPIHETGQQLLQCGRLVRGSTRFPHFGAVVTKERGASITTPMNVVLPRMLRDTGVHQEHGQSSGLLGPEYQPVELSVGPAEEPESVTRTYGDSEFGRRLRHARQLVEQGSRCVTVNLFDQLHQNVTWDCHGDPLCGPATIADYRDHLGPQFDQALAGLLDDLEQRGLLEDTLVVATGEFGRTPWINDRHGRDHWPGCWSGLIAGGAIRGGMVLGASDATASAPTSRPVSPAEITATLLAWFGIDGRRTSIPVGDVDVAAVPADPLRELFA